MRGCSSKWSDLIGPCFALSCTSICSACHQTPFLESGAETRHFHDDRWAVPRVWFKNSNTTPDSSISRFNQMRGSFPLLPGGVFFIMAPGQHQWTATSPERGWSHTRSSLSQQNGQENIACTTPINIAVRKAQLKHGILGTLHAAPLPTSWGRRAGPINCERYHNIIYYSVVQYTRHTTCYPAIGSLLSAFDVFLSINSI